MKGLVAVLFLVLLLAAPAASARSQGAKRAQLTVYAAASLTNV